MSRLHIVQLACIVLAAALLLASGPLQRHIQAINAQADPFAEEKLAAMEGNPSAAALTAVPGGLRVLFVNWLWITSQKDHNEGRHHDAYQKAEMICQLQPYFPGVWAFQAWQMAWNISVKTHTRQERWRWVYNGVELLRDRAIPLNPRSLLLYKELAWIFFSKIGGQLDDMHESYKQRWAGMMQHLLGAPPLDEALDVSLAEQTREVIDAFVPITEAPLDKDPRRQGRQRIQPDQREVLLSDPAVSAYAKSLAEAGMPLDEAFLEAYNRWSTDSGVALYYLVPPQPANEDERRIRDLINAPDHAGARGRVLAFLRAQLLWNVYRLDPDFMLELMRRYELPLDWRHAMAHGLYWAAYGNRVCNAQLSDTDVLNNTRNVLNSLKTMTWTGLVTLQARPEQPAYPLYTESPDLRFIAPTHRQHEEFIEERIALSGKEFNRNIYDAGHINYLEDAINLLVADGRIDRAQFYYDYIRDQYRRTAGLYESDSVQDFVLANLRKEGSLRYAVAQQLLLYTFKRAYLARGMYDDEAEFRKRFEYARRIYSTYQSSAVERLKLPGDFRMIAAQTLTMLLRYPARLGVNLSLADRSDIYRAMSDQPAVQVPVWANSGMRRFLQGLCRAEGVDFNAAFPKPPGVEEFVEEQQRRMSAPTPMPR
jgi:hypothetical protein